MKLLLFQYWKYFLIALLAIYLLPVMYYIVAGTLNQTGAKDFHQFWYAGQFILLGRDPYQAYLSGAELPMRQPGLEIIPSNSPPMLLALTLFSLLPWTVAKLVWLVVNLLLVYVCFRLVEKCLPFPNVLLDRPTRVLFLLIFIDLSPTRIAIENGQTTLIVFALMLAAILLAGRSWLLAGLLLGLALSKYSASLPVALFFLYHRNFRILMTAVLIQFLGFVGLSMLSGNPLGFVFAEYLRLFIVLIDQPGIHLATLIPGTRFYEIIPAAMTVALALYLYFWLIRGRVYQRVDTRVFDFHLLTIFTLWSLMVAYHRLYDALLLLLLIMLVFKSSLHAEIWDLSPRMRAALACGLGVGLALLTIPARIVDRLLPGAYDPLTNGVPAMILLVFLAALMFLFHRFLSQPVSQIS